MPEPYWPKKNDYPLSRAAENRSLLRCKCRYCQRTVIYRPEDLIQIFGDRDVDSLMDRMKCEVNEDHGYLDVKCFSPTGSEAVGLKIRRLVRLEIKRVPVWKED